MQPPELMAVLENGVSRAKRPPVRSVVTLGGYTANQLSYEVWKGTAQENVHVRMFVNEGGCMCKGKIPRKRAVTEANGNGVRVPVVHSHRNEECKHDVFEKTQNSAKSILVSLCFQHVTFPQ